MKLQVLLLSAILLVGCNSDKKKEKTELKIGDEYVNNSSIQNTTSESYQRGKEVYNDFCVTCHLPSGKGIPGNFPPLANSNWLQNKREESIHAIKYGLSGPIVVNGNSYNNVMTAQGLSDQEVADVMNYISNSWGNMNEKEVSLKEVNFIRK